MRISAEKCVQRPPAPVCFTPITIVVALDIVIFPLGMIYRSRAIK